jgi:hypothetical protein
MDSKLFRSIGVDYGRSHYFFLEGSDAVCQQVHSAIFGNAYALTVSFLSRDFVFLATLYFFGMHFLFSFFSFLLVGVFSIISLLGSLLELRS